MKPNLLALLRQGLGNPNATFHSGQEDAIRSVIEPPFRALVVQATGWGKSMVYFLATKVLRDQGKGPTLVVSPLLSLMRNQVSAASNLGLVADHYTSANSENWTEIESRLLNDQIDLLLISPERLANEGFQDSIASSRLAHVGLLVIDEAHCISDWGHDFRPDYQRLGRLIRNLPVSTSVLATTATANDRVVEDILGQIGESIPLIRGSLARTSLMLQVVKGMSITERLAWLSDHLDDFDGSGIIYTLTKADADRVASWLRTRGHVVEAYHAGLGNSAQESSKLRTEREELLINNQVKALVATVALGMGFDKPDLGFVIHYQSPSNLVAYYQQIGRAGRAIESASAVLLLGQEDDAIHEYFIEKAAPDSGDIDNVLTALEEAENGLSDLKLTGEVNLRLGEVKSILKRLSVLEPSPVVKVGNIWQRTPHAYAHDHARHHLLRESRKAERSSFLQFANGSGCLMEQVRLALNDDDSLPCGKCSNCLGQMIVPIGYDGETLQAAQQFLNESEFTLEPRRRWESGAMPTYAFSGNIAMELQCASGLCLSRYGEPGIGVWVREDKAAGSFRNELIEACFNALVRNGFLNRLDWIAAVPSRRSESVPNFAQKLAQRLDLPFLGSISKIRDTRPQKKQRNSFHQSANLDGAFSVDQVLPGTVLLVDDMVDSRWTFTIVGALLRQAGVDSVVPLALTSTANWVDDE